MSSLAKLLSIIVVVVLAGFTLYLLFSFFRSIMDLLSVAKRFLGIDATPLVILVIVLVVIMFVLLVVEVISYNKYEFPFHSFSLGLGDV